MRKIAMFGLVAGAALFLGACRHTSKSGSMGTTSGECSTDKACCKEKAAMGAVSGEKKDCCKSKASMGAVSGECSSSKTSCTDKGAMGAVSGSCSSKSACTKQN